MEIPQLILVCVVQLQIVYLNEAGWLSVDTQYKA